MRKATVIGSGAVAALAIAAVAAAAVFTAAGVTPATADFTAAKNDVKSRTCTGADNKAFTVTHGHYTGTANFASPNSVLGGPLTIDARTTYSTTDGYGTVDGSFRIKDSDTKLNGRFTGTLKGTALVGFLTANGYGSHARVVGNLSATFDPATGFTAGLIGSTSSTAVLAVVAGPVCKGEKPKPNPPAPKPKTIEAHGTITALTPDLSVATKGPTTVTCKIPAGSTLTTGFKTGDKVEMKCTYDSAANGWVLSSLKLEK